MAKRGKKYIKIAEKKPTKVLKLSEGIESVKKLSYSKFPGSIEMHLVIKLPKDKEAKSIKGALSLPHSVGKTDTKIAVFTSEGRYDEAKNAGADYYDMEKLTEMVKSGKFDFDVTIATPDVMPKIAALGKELGPRGLMPNPKTGTVSDDLAKTVEEYKKGKITFKADDSGNMHFTLGKVDMETEKLVENAHACFKAAGEAVGKSPETIISAIHLAPTMGPSVKVDKSEV